MGGLGHRRARVLPALLASLVMACGPATDDPPATPAGGDGARTEDPTLRAIVDGELTRVATDAHAERAVVYGGADATGTASDVGVVLSADGSLTRFETGLGFAEASVALTGDRVVVAGRQCTSSVEITDTGVSCEPGTAAAVSVDIETERATSIDLDADGAEGPSRAEVFRYGTAGDVVVQVIGTGWSRAVRVSPDGSVEHLSGSVGLVYCASDGGLFAAVPVSEASRPMRPEVDPPTSGRTGGDEPDGAAPEHLRVLVHRIDEDGWTRVDLDVSVAGVNPACSRRGLVVFTQPGVPPVLLSDDGQQQVLPLLDVGYISDVFSNGSDELAVQGDDGLVLLDTEAEGNVEHIDRPVAPLDGQTLPVLVDGSVRLIVPSGLSDG